MDRAAYFREYHRRRYGSDPEFAERKRKIARKHSRARYPTLSAEKKREMALRKKVIGAAREESQARGVPINIVLSEWGAPPLHRPKAVNPKAPQVSKGA